METIRPLIIKFIYIAAITIIFLTYLQIPAVPLGTSLILALFITPVLYLAGERYLLPQFGAAASAIANFVLAAIILSLSNTFVREQIAAGAILSAAAVIGAAEWFYFRYAPIVAAPASAMEGGGANPFTILGEPAPEQAGESMNQENSEQQQGQPEQPEQTRNEG